LLCDPLLDRDLEALPAGSLPPCATAAAALEVDAWHNPAYDGLLAAPPQYTKASYCNPLFHEVNSDLLPRRAYYALRTLWAVSSENRSSVESTTIPSEWKISAQWAASLLRHDDDFSIAVLLLWLVLLAFVLACSRGILGLCGGIAGRGSTLVALILLFVLSLVNLRSVQLPLIVVSTLNEVTSPCQGAHARAGPSAASRAIH
jgi:hypothetical protein